MLKNPIEIPEYVLLSEDLYRTRSAPLPAPAQQFSQECEGIGKVSAYFVDVAPGSDVPPPMRAPSPLRQGISSSSISIRPTTRGSTPATIMYPR